MTKILCLFGFHAFEYEENILTGKRYKVADIAASIVKPELIAFALMSPLVFLIIYAGVVMNGF